MDCPTFISEVRNIVTSRLNQPYNLEEDGESRIEIETPSGSKVMIALIEDGDSISITTKNQQGHSSFNVSSDTGLFAVDAILRVL